MEIPKEIYEQITSYSEVGNVLLEKGDASAAYSNFENAADLLPEPQTAWEAYPWLVASMGECRFIEAKYEEACDCFLAAYNATVPNASPYVLLRLGECCIETKKPNAEEFLFRAYLLAGKDIFKAENKKYFESIQPLIKKASKSKMVQDNNAKTVQHPVCKRMSEDDTAKYNKAFDLGSQYYEQGDWDNYIKAMVSAWKEIPEPREEYAESFEFLIIFIPNALKYGDTKAVMEWIPILQSAGVDRPDIGEREYYIGCIYYENGLYEQAGEMFEIADHKSRGRIFSDKKYKKIYKEWKKAKKN